MLIQIGSAKHRLCKCFSTNFELVSKLTSDNLLKSIRIERDRSGGLPPLKCIGYPDSIMKMTRKHSKFKCIS